MWKSPLLTHRSYCSVALSHRHKNSCDGIIHYIIIDEGNMPNLFHSLCSTWYPTRDNMQYFLCIVTSSTDGRYMLFNQDDVIKRKHFTHYWPFMRGIHRSPVNSQHKGHVFLDLHLNKQLCKQWRRRQFETPSRSLWRHYEYRRLLKFLTWDSTLIWHNTNPRRGSLILTWIDFNHSVYNILCPSWNVRWSLLHSQISTVQLLQSGNG